MMVDNVQSVNFTPIKIDDDTKGVSLKGMLTCDLTKNVYVRIAIVIVILIFGALYVIDYMSPVNRCVRQAEKTIQMAQELVGSSNAAITDSLMREKREECRDKHR